MINEGTTLLQVRKNHSSDEGHWFEEIRKRSVFSFFPEIVDQILAAGELRRLGRGLKLNMAGGRLESFFMGANAPLALKLSSGRMGDENLHSKVRPLDVVGFKELLEATYFPFSIETEEENTFVFSIRRVELLAILADGKITEELKVLTSSKSIFNFSKWLVLQKVSMELVRELCLRFEGSRVLDKHKEIQLKEPALICIEDGAIQVLSMSEDNDLMAYLENGDWFGASTGVVDSPLKLRFSVVEDCHIRKIKWGDLLSKLPPKITDKIALEPCIDRANTSLNYIESEQTPTEFRVAGDLKTLKKYGFQVDPSLLKLTQQSSEFTFVTLWNQLQFFEVNMHEKQVQALVETRSLNTLGGFAKIFEDLGYLTVLQRIPSDFQLQPESPMLFLGFGKPLLILKLARSQVFMLDPQYGVVSFSKDQLFSRWNRVCLRVRQSHAKQALKSQLDVLIEKPEVSGRMLLKYFLKLTNKEVRNVFIFRLFQSLAVLFVPSYLLGLINQVVTYKRFDHLSIYYVGLGIFICFQIVSLFLNSYFSNLIVMRFKTIVQPYFYKLFLNQPNNFGSSIRAGYIQSRLQLIDFTMSGLKAFKIDLVQSVLTLFMFFVFVGFYSWQAALVLSIFCAAGAMTTFYLKRNGGLDEIGTAQQRQEFVDSGLDLLNGFESIKISHSERWIRDRFEKIILQVSAGSAEFAKMNMSFAQLGTIIFKLGSTIALFVVISDLLASQGSPAKALALSMYLSYCSGPYQVILNLLSTYNLKSLYALPGQLIKGEGKANYNTSKIISLKGNVRLERVSFRYSDRSPMILNDLSFSVKSGQVVAVVGRSGSGKTTLGRVLARQAEVSSGKIIFDEVDSRLIDSNSLVSQIGFVSQTPTLFRGTIAQNISLNDEALGYQRIVEACEASNAHDFIQKLPGGYNYMLREGGRGLSGGQKVLLTLARVLYSRPKILILDEATAHLDPMSERMVSDRLLQFHGRQTVFVIVQRISTARRADLILVMKNGRVVESGDHNFLLQLNGEYAELYRHQVGGDQ